jgi:hypothetical protein
MLQLWEIRGANNKISSFVCSTLKVGAARVPTFATAVLAAIK